MVDKNYVPRRLREPAAPPSDEAAKGTSIWLVSFTDVVALMLTFFVLIFSMSSPTIESFNETISVMETNASVELGAPEHAGSMAKLDLSRENKVGGLALVYLESLLQGNLNQMQEEAPALRDLSLVRSDGGLFIVVPAKLARKKEILQPLASMLGRLNNDILIQAPVDNARRTFAQTLMKAANLAKTIQDLGYSKKIAVKTFSPLYSKGLSAQLHIAIMETKTVSLK